MFSCYSGRVAASSTSASRVETVVERIRQDIFEGRYPPGSPLRELILARELSVSQATVREALQRLEYAGLVSRRANVGSTVTRLSPKDVRERVELRTILEVQAAWAAAERMGEAEFAELEARLAALESAVEANRYYESAQADLEFHRYIWQCSGNDTLCRHLELLIIPLFAFISILRSQGLERLLTVVEAHRPLIDALRSHDPRRIRAEFEKGATSAYALFVRNGPEQTVAAAFGLLDPPGRD
jgi:DNA-binding GntR family transcriptional regulator